MQEKVILIEDDKTQALILLHHLADLEFEVDHFFTAEEALEALEKDEYGLVLLDLLLPGMSGVEFLKTVRKTYTSMELPVIVISCQGSSRDFVQGLKNGANDYISKPFDMDVALARIQTHLKLQRLHHECVRNRELQAMQAMVVTYNHELNNKLAIALGQLDRGIVLGDELKLRQAQQTLEKLGDLIKKIKVASGKEISLVPYGKKKMVAID